MNALCSSRQTTKPLPPFEGDPGNCIVVTVCYIHYIARCAALVARGLVESVGGEFGGTKRCVFSTILLIRREK